MGCQMGFREGSGSQVYVVGMTGAYFGAWPERPSVRARWLLQRRHAPQKGVVGGLPRDLCTIAMRLVKQHISACEKPMNVVGDNLTI